MALSLREDRKGGPVDHFLALLQDRLPLWLRILHNLTPGRGRVTDNLIFVARAGIDHYVEVQSAALPAFTEPSVTVRFRKAVRDSGLGPMAEILPLAAYLEAEQRLGRIVASADPQATARLLLAGCFQHAYYEMFVGADAGPTRDNAAVEIVRELRLEPSDGGHGEGKQKAEQEAGRGSGRGSGRGEPTS